jgi:hypothetical protein
VTAAVVGAIGVILGALLGGVASDAVERRKVRVAGRAAARAIGAELALAASKLGSATAPSEEASGPAAGGAGATAPVEEPGWWLGVPSTRAWEARFDALAAIAPKEVIEDLATAYAQIESWKSQRQQATESWPSQAQVDELKKDVVLVVDAKRTLETFVSASRFQRATRWTPDVAPWRVIVFRWVPALLVVVALGAVLLVPRDDVNAQTVAAAVEKGEGPHALAECDRVMDHWSCSVLTTVGARDRCLSGGVVASSAVPAAAIATACQTLGPPQSVTVVDTGDRLIITPGEKERSQNRNRFSEAAMTRSLIVRAWRALWGKSPNGP